MKLLNPAPFCASCLFWECAVAKWTKILGQLLKKKKNHHTKWNQTKKHNKKNQQTNNNKKTPWPGLKLSLTAVETTALVLLE